MKTGCVVIHGFGGSSYEVAPLSDYLRDMGFPTLCPSLEGHTGKRRDLAASNYKDWIKSAENGLLSLEKDCGRIVLIGFSMGGLIAVNLAREFNVAAVITLNTPIYLWEVNRIAANIYNDLKRKDYSNLKRYMKAAQGSSIPALINFRTLLSITKPMLKKVQCPVFVAQALEDDTVRIKSADYIYRNAASEHKLIKYYPGSGHLICRSTACKELFKDIAGFIGDIPVPNNVVDF